MLSLKMILYRLTLLSTIHYVIGVYLNDANFSTERNKFQIVEYFLPECLQYRTVLVSGIFEMIPLLLLSMDRNQITFLFLKTVSDKFRGELQIQDFLPTHDLTVYLELY